MGASAVHEHRAHETGAIATRDAHIACACVCARVRVLLPLRNGQCVITSETRTTDFGVCALSYWRQQSKALAFRTAHTHTPQSHTHDQRSAHARDRHQTPSTTQLLVARQHPLTTP